MGQISRVTDFQNGNPPFSDDLNSEMNQIVSTGNNVDNTNFNTSAPGASPIDPAKLDSDLAGDGLTRDGVTGIYDLNPDDVSLELNSDALRAKDAGTDADMLATDSVTTVKIQDGAVTREKLAVNKVEATLATLQNISSGSTVPVLVTGSITTVGRPVMVALMDSTITVSRTALVVNAWSNQINMFLKRGSTVISRIDMAQFFSVGAGTGTIKGCTLRLPLTFWVIDTPGAGTYTYTFEVTSPGNDNIAQIAAGLRLAAYEL